MGVATPQFSLFPEQSNLNAVTAQGKFPKQCEAQLLYSVAVLATGKPVLLTLSSATVAVIAMEYQSKQNTERQGAGRRKNKARELQQQRIKILS